MPAAPDVICVDTSIVAALAADHGATLWSLDGDFTRMARLRFVRLHVPPR